MTQQPENSANSIHHEWSAGMCRKNFLKLTLQIVLGLLAWGGIDLAVAQAPTATLVGQVTDSTNASVVGATVSVRDTATNLMRTAPTGPGGEETISDLPIGTFA